MSDWLRLVEAFRRQMSLDDEGDRQREQDEGFDQWSIFTESEPEAEKEPPSVCDEEAG